MPIDNITHCEGDAFPCRHGRVTGATIPENWTYEDWGFPLPRVRCGDCTNLAQNRMNVGARIQKRILDEWQRT